jgi:long-chain fatty acid transport protein
VDSKYTIQALADTYVTWKSKDLPIALGLGFYSPFGLGIEYPDDSAFRTLGKKATIEFFTANPVIAWKINDQLSVAAGVSLNYSRAKLARGIIIPGDEFQVEAAGFGVGVTAGLLWQPTKQHSFGVQYFGPVDITYSGHARTRIPAFTTQFQVAPGVVVPVQVPRLENEEDSDIELNLPQTITGGYSFRPTDDWNFEFDLSWTDWDRLNSPTLHLSENPDAPLVFNYRSSFIYEFGVTKKFGRDWRVSAGYLYSENSVPNEYFNPLVPDTDRHVLSIGVGRKFEHWDLYLGYQYAFSPHREISRRPLPGEGSFGDQSLADGSYHFQAHALSLSVGYSF